MLRQRQLPPSHCDVCGEFKLEVYSDVDTVTGVICFSCIVDHDVAYALQVFV